MSKRSVPEDIRSGKRSVGGFLFWPGEMNYLLSRATRRAILAVQDPMPWMELDIHPIQAFERAFHIAAYRRLMIAKAAGMGIEETAPGMRMKRFPPR